MAHFTDGTQSASSRVRGHRKRRRKAASENQPLSFPVDRGVVARMLATDDTLLKMCLRKGNYSQAAQVLRNSLKIVNNLLSFVFCLMIL